MALFTTVVRYGKLDQTARVASEVSDFDLGDPCIVKTERGTEWATITSIPRPAEDLRKVSAHKILRRADDNDQAHRDRLPDLENQAIHRCDEMIAEQKLEMTVVGCEVLFGGEQTVVYFQAEDRVDFRRLVAELGHELITRVEMRQLGEREVARLLGDVGGCGLTLCCKTHIKKFSPVNMKMARIQMSSLQAEKLSGSCGRLKCCLRYEYEMYLELFETLPQKKKQISLPDGRRATVLDVHPLEQTVFLNIDGRRETLTAADYLSLASPGCSTGGGCSSGGCGR